MKTFKYKEDGVDVEELPLIGNPVSIKTAKQGRSKSVSKICSNSSTHVVLGKKLRHLDFQTAKERKDFFNKASIACVRIKENPRSTEKQVLMANEFLNDRLNKHLAKLVLKIARKLHKKLPCF